MKQGLEEFIKIYDIAGEMGWLALDLAQNLSFRYELAKDKTVQEDDVHMAYGLVGMGKKYPLDLMAAIHGLAKALGYTPADYIEGADKRRGRGNVNIYVAGQGSINMDAKELFESLCDETDEKGNKDSTKDKERG